MLVLETAKPEKFAETILEAIGVDIEYAPDVRRMLDAPQHVVQMAADEHVLRAYIAANALH